MNRATKISLVIAVLILLCGGTVFGYRAGWLWENAEQRQVREMKTELATKLKEQSSMRPSPQLFETMRKQVESLPEQYRQQFMQSARNVAMNEFERRIDEYLAMSPLERRKEMDKRIAEMEQMRKQFEQRRKQQQASSASQGGAPGGAGGGPGGAPPTAGGPPAGGPPGGGAPGGPRGMFGGPPGGGRGMSGMLDATTPEFRAKMAVVMRDMETRRKELGLPPMGRR